MTSFDPAADPGSVHSEALCQVDFSVNGRAVTVSVEARKTLADTLRDDLGLTGTHLGCEHGVCGACTVLIDSEPVRSCLMLAVQADGARVTTIEGLAGEGGLHPVQQAMHDAMSFQCAFCAPGFLLNTVALLDRIPHPTPGQIRDELSGNLCRCTGYQSILEGVETAVRLITSSRNRHRPLPPPPEHRRTEQRRIP